MSSTEWRLTLASSLPAAVALVDEVDERERDTGGRGQQLQPRRQLGSVRHPPLLPLLSPERSGPITARMSFFASRSPPAQSVLPYRVSVSETSIIIV
jgi:hypothetical protein